MSFKKKLCLILYYAIGIYLPRSAKCLKIGGVCRRFLCKRIFKKCGVGVNIERGAKFGNGRGVELGDYSGIGINAVIPNNSIIGKYVMMGPNVYIFSRNHEYSDTSIPMQKQGNTEHKGIVIEDDVWIGQNVMIMPGRTIKKGSIIAAGCVLCKDFPSYSVIGGNPSRLLKSRI